MDRSRMAWLVALAGSACSAGAVEEAPRLAEALPRDRIGDMTRVYLHAPSGERVEVRGPHVSRVGGHAAGGVRGDGTAIRVWINNNFDPCGYGDADGPDDVPGTADDDLELGGIRVVSAGTDDGSVPLLGFQPSRARENDAVQMDWGDVPANSRVNALGFWAWHNYITPGWDPDGADTIPGTSDDEPNPGVPGFAMRLSFFDGLEGSILAGGVIPPSVQPVVQLAFEMPSARPDLDVMSELEGFYLFVELTDADPANDMTFELGDNDGEGPASGLFNAFGFFDSVETEDADCSAGSSLHDFGYGFDFVHPPELQTGVEYAATMTAYGDVTYLFSDTDGDGEPENTFVPLMDNGFASGMGAGSCSYDFHRVWADGYSPSTGLPEGYVGAFFFGGFTCGFSRDDCARNPHSRAFLEMYFTEPTTGGCVGDWDRDGSVGIFDVLAYLKDWTATEGTDGSPLGTDLNASGVVDIFDLVAFLALWNTDSVDPGCVGSS